MLKGKNYKKKKSIKNWVTGTEKREYVIYNKNSLLYQKNYKDILWTEIIV